MFSYFRFPEIPIQVLDLSANFAKEISPSLFAHCDFTSIEVLFIGENDIGQILSRNANTTFLSPLSGLKVGDQ